METQITEGMVYERLRTVMDPELHIDIVSLGLIYRVDVRRAADGGQQVEVIMTLTTPGCPLAPVIDKMIKEALKPLRAKTVELRLVWEPAWTKSLMSEEARLQLGITQ